MEHAQPMVILNASKYDSQEYPDGIFSKDVTSPMLENLTDRTIDMNFNRLGLITRHYPLTSH